MKYLIFVLILASTAFAQDTVLVTDSLIPTLDTVYVVDVTPEPYDPPEPIDVTVKPNDYVVQSQEETNRIYQELRESYGD